MNFDSNEDVLVITEIRVNHEGSINYALNLMNLAADAGARIVKFQSYTQTNTSLLINQKD